MHAVWKNSVVVSGMQALDLADEKGTDVVMISPDASPPVVRLIEVSKLKYEQEKAKKEAGRKSRAARCAFRRSLLGMSQC